MKLPAPAIEEQLEDLAGLAASLVNVLALDLGVQQFSVYRRARRGLTTTRFHGPYARELQCRFASLLGRPCGNCE